MYYEQVVMLFAFILYMILKIKIDWLCENIRKIIKKLDIE